MRIRIFAFFVLLIPACVMPLSADSLTYTVSPSGDQLLYNFTLTNSGGTGGSIFDLFVNLPITIDGIDAATIGIPAGWGDANGGMLFYGPDTNPSTTFIQWSSDVSGAYDVRIGGSQSGFSVVARERITGPVLYALNGGTTFDEASDIPEPATLTLAGLALGAICAARAFAKSKA